MRPDTQLSKPSKEKRMPRNPVFCSAALAAALIAAPAARAETASKITSLEVAPQGGRLVIHANQKPEFTVF